MKSKYPTSTEMEKIFKAKDRFHKEQAKLPFEEKIKILVKLQQIAYDVSGLKKKGDRMQLPVWEI